MKTITKMGAQGDVLFRRVPARPKEAVRSESLVVAHSETGHNHVAVGQAALYEMPGNPLLGYLVAKGPVRVEHHRSFDTHAPLELLYDDSQGEVIWEIRRQREHAPEGWRAVLD